MPSVVSMDLPPAALLHERRRQGCYTDCFGTTLPVAVSLAQFVGAFYTTPLFKMERCVLCLLGRPSSDREATELAAGRREAFAVWRVAAREPDQLLLTDETGRTSSWLMTMPLFSPTGTGTRLFFGSAVVPRGVAPNGEPQFGFLFHALLGAHRLYSRGLLRVAARRLLVDAAASHRTG